MAVRSSTFNGASVYLSRNLVPPEMYDSLHDALRLNGAQIFLCCDPSRNGPTDYHVISSPEHEKFQDLKSKGCNLIGPHCVLSCAKERKGFPKQVYTCCLAMDGIKILVSGFEKDEKNKIEQLVTAMGGTLHSKTSLDVTFVIVKDVLAAKYKWALNVLKKPMVNISWLNQCWAEHRLAPQERHRILPFAGLTICVTRIPVDKRKEIERLILNNGGQYSGDLTKKCTHLVSDAPEGDKYFVAKRWGHIHIVTHRWIDQSVARKACMEEGNYSVCGTSISRNSKSDLNDHLSQDWISQSTGFRDLETPVSQRIPSTFSDAITTNSDNEATLSAKAEAKFDQCVAEDSEDEDNDLYLSNCRVSFLGFEEKEQSRLVGLIRKGGGTRHISLSEKLTHIIVGSPSENEWKEVRRLAAWGVIDVVKAVWLEDCDRSKKEIPVMQKHIFFDLRLSKDSLRFSKVSSTGVADTTISKSSPTIFRIPVSEMLEDECYEGGRSISENMRQKQAPESNSLEANRPGSSAKFEKSQVLFDNIEGSRLHVESDSTDTSRKSLNIFKGLSFCFSHTFPIERRDDIIEWIRQGCGQIVDEDEKARFIIDCHGLKQNDIKYTKATVVSSHWIHCCLEEGFIQDVASHILFSPLRCCVPLPGFEGFRFCVSQYEVKERQLLRNLCFTLGSKCTEKLNKRVTHLLCKFTSGPKYEAARKWGVQLVTAEWITECVKQDMVVSLDSFRPKSVTAQDREEGLCTATQYPTQAAGLISEDLPSQLSAETLTALTGSNHRIELIKSVGKKRRLSENDCVDSLPSKTKTVEDPTDASASLPDVAAAIEDLLEQSNKVQDQKLPDGDACNRSIFSPDRSIIGRDHVDSISTFRVSNNWLDRTRTNFSISSPDRDRCQRTFDSFSETQTESQVVGYEEDLSGRQKIIDRVRSQSLTLTPEK